jgi:hypothetical protein
MYAPDGKAEEVGVMELPLNAEAAKPANDTAPKYEATLEDGTKVYGLSALRRQQHLALQQLDDAIKATSATSPEGAHKRVLAYGQGAGHPTTDEQLMAEAKKLGLDQQLREVAATQAYQRLKGQAFRQPGGWAQRGRMALALHTEPVLSAVAGEAPNPLNQAQSPLGAIWRYASRDIPRSALDLSGASAAGKLGSDAARIRALLGLPPEEQQ